MPVASLSHLAGKVAFGEEEIKKNEKKIDKELLDRMYKKFMTEYFDSENNLRMFGKPLRFYGEDTHVHTDSYSGLYISAKKMMFKFSTERDSWDFSRVDLNFIGWYSPRTKKFSCWVPGIEEETIEKDWRLVYRWRVENPTAPPTQHFTMSDTYEGALVVGNKNHRTRAENVQDGCVKRPELNPEQLYTLCKIVDLSLPDTKIWRAKLNTKN